ncbi:MAG: trypsin-like peptidase domain-containing protein [Acidimicrobiia bacterium]
MPRDARLLVVGLVVAYAVVGWGSPPLATEPNDIEGSVVRVAGTACLKPILATGFVVADGTIVTVAHGIAGVDDDLRVIDASGASYAVEVTAFDDQLDIAVMAVDGLDGTVISAASAQPGDTGVITAMSPESEIDFIEYDVLRIVSAHSGDIYDSGQVERTAIDVNAAARRGTSGAPLINRAGSYIGMVFAISRDRENGAYAIAASEIVDYLASLPTGVVPDRGRCR